MSVKRTIKDSIQRNFLLQSPTLLAIALAGFAGACSLIIMGCASYGVGGVYSSNNRSEIGAYIFGDSENAETTLSYAKNLSGKDTQSLGAGFSLKAPISFWGITLFPLVNIDYQWIFDGTENVSNLGWVRFGGGLDFSINNAFYVRGEWMYTSDLFSSLLKIDAVDINPATGYTIRFGVGWRPGVAIISKRKETPVNKVREQTNQAKTNAVQTENIYRGDTMVSIPYDKNGRSWLIFQPSIPNDVPPDIYNKLWNINQKTIKAGKYDFNAFNYNTAQWITFDESAMSDSYTFAGVCSNYADYFIFVLKHDSVLLELYNKGIITANTSPTHKWIEYRTENNRYIIDPTWCDWDYVGEPRGIYAGNAEFAEACRTSFNRDALIEANAKEWFFRNVNTVTSEFDMRAHGRTIE
jgi:hypothetical protein